jgi:DNA polymerase-1
MLSAFREVVVLDFEFTIAPGDRSRPACLVARELVSGRHHRVWADGFGPNPPYPTGNDVLVVAYYASAELGCYRALNWPMPTRILDLFAEFRNITNGLPTVAGAGLLGALAHYGLDTINAVEKKELQQAIGTGTWEGTYTP